MGLINWRLRKVIDWAALIDWTGALSLAAAPPPLFLEMYPISFSHSNL